MKCLKLILLLSMILGFGLFSTGCSMFSGENAVTANDSNYETSSSSDTDSSTNISSQEENSTMDSSLDSSSLDNSSLDTNSTEGSALNLSNDDENESISITNPMEEWKNIKEAETCLGFSVKTPDYLPKGYEQVRIDTISQDILQITYEDTGKKEEEKSDEDSPQCIYRTAQINGDISGDFNQYSQEKTVTIDEMDISMVGNDDLIELARWITEEYSYSVRFEEPVKESVAKKVIESIK